MFFPLLYPGIARVDINGVFIAMQQLSNLGHVGHIGRCAVDEMNQSRLYIRADMRLHCKEELVPLMRWSTRFEKPGKSRLTGFLSLPKEDLS